METDSKRISLPDEEPEIFSSVLEYLYKGDYYPKLVHNKRRNAWELETGEGGTGSVESTVYHHGIDGELLKDTVIYCTAEKYGLDELKRVALRKQGLRMSFSSFSSLTIYTNETQIDGRKQNPAFNAAQFSPPPVMPTPIHLTPTPSSEPTTLLSSSVLEEHSSVAGLCRWRCKLVVRSCSLICSWRCATTSTMSLRLRKYCCLFLLLPSCLLRLFPRLVIGDELWLTSISNSGSPRSVRTHH